MKDIIYACHCGTVMKKRWNGAWLDLTCPSCDWWQGFRYDLGRMR